MKEVRIREDEINRQSWKDLKSFGLIAAHKRQQTARTDQLYSGPHIVETKVKHGGEVS